MPAEKSARVQERRRMINRRVRTGSRTAVKKAVQAISTSTPEEAKPSVVNAVSALDRAASKGVIHKNAAARKKSRLMKRLNAAANNNA